MDNLKSLEVRMGGKVVGTLAMTSDALCACEYDAQWMADGFSILPFELPLFQVASELTHSIAELWKVYRLICFNYLIGNKDDHAKNFAFIYHNGEWHFAPAYDFLPSDGINGYQTTSINDYITPQDCDLLSIANRFGLDEGKPQQY